MSDGPVAPAGQQRVRVLVVDDEPLARRRLEDLLRRETCVELAAAVADGLEATEAIRALRPDIVLLDVQMPRMSGLDVIREIGPEAMPATIFVTAYDQYTLQAFDVAAVDYLVKPFDDERFRRAFLRARRRVALAELELLRAKLRSVLTEDADGAPPAPRSGAPTRWLERIAVEVRDRVRPVPVHEIDCITASGPYCELHVRERRLLVRDSLQTLEARLDPDHFMRVHRSAIVRLDLIEALHRASGGEYEIQLKGGSRIKVSRTRREALERWLGVSS